MRVVGVVSHSFAHLRPSDAPTTVHARPGEFRVDIGERRLAAAG